MNNESAKVIVSLIGVAGLILYGYLIFMSDISADYQKYTVLAASLGVLYPLGALSDNEYLSGNGYKAFGIGLLGACVILFAGYASKIDTEDGLIWDFFKAITTEGYRYFYFFLLLVANILPLVSKKYSIWLSAFTVGIMIPVLIASVLALALIIAGLSLLGAYGKSNKGSNSWSSIFSNPSTSTTSYKNSSTNAPNMPIQTKQNNNRKDVAKERNDVSDDIGKSWTYGSACFKGRQPSSGMLLGGVHVWYNGSLTQTSYNGGVQIWEGTGNICVVYPRNYTGPKMEFYSSGGSVQIQIC